MVQREKIVSSGQILGEFRPKMFLRKLNAFLETITPEEVETLIVIKNVKFYYYLIDFLKNFNDLEFFLGVEKN